MSAKGPLGGNRRGQGRRGDPEREIGWGGVCRRMLRCVLRTPEDSIQPHTSSEVEESGEKGWGGGEGGRPSRCPVLTSLRLPLFSALLMGVLPH